MSAFGGKADIAVSERHVRFSPKADLSGSRLLPRNLTPKPRFAGHKSLL
jgi:hypothetical protein